MKRAFLTKHAQERLQERHDRWLLPYHDAESFLYSCLELFNDRAVESNRHVNDTALMTRLHEQYGYEHKYSFRVYENALFVIVDGRCVTVLDTTVHTYSRQFNPRKAAPTGKTVTRRRPDNRVSKSMTYGIQERSQQRLDDVERRQMAGDYDGH